MTKIIRILSCKCPTVNISKLNYWLVICIAKNFIWTTLKVIFSIFRFFCTLRFQIYKYCPIITHHTSMKRLFIQLLDDVYISILKNWHLILVLCSRVTYYHPALIIYSKYDYKVGLHVYDKNHNCRLFPWNCNCDYYLRWSSQFTLNDEYF